VALFELASICPLRRFWLDSHDRPQSVAVSSTAGSYSQRRQPPELRILNAPNAVNDDKRHGRFVRDEEVVVSNPATRQCQEARATIDGRVLVSDDAWRHSSARRFSPLALMRVPLCHAGHELLKVGANRSDECTRDEQPGVGGLNDVVHAGRVCQ